MIAMITKKNLPPLFLNDIDFFMLHSLFYISCLRLFQRLIKFVLSQAYGFSPDILLIEKRKYYVLQYLDICFYSMLNFADEYILVGHVRPGGIAGPQLYRGYIEQCLVGRFRGYICFTAQRYCSTNNRMVNINNGRP